MKKSNLELNWDGASEQDLILLKSMQILFSHNRKILNFLFDLTNPRLRMSSDLLIRESQSYSSGEQLLVKIALDIWDESGGTQFSEIYKLLDDENFKMVLITLLYLRDPLAD